MPRRLVFVALFVVAVLLATAVSSWVAWRGVARALETEFEQRIGRIAATAAHAVAFNNPLDLAGAAGNLCDRARLGHVVDFIDFFVAAWDWHYPTFNVADTAITCGVALVLFDGFVLEKRTRTVKLY